MNIGRDKFIKFVLNVSVKDGNSNISIYHNLNNTTGNRANVSLINVAYKEIEYNNPIPNNINAGEYNITFIVTDQYGITSNYSLIIVKFDRYTSGISYIHHVHQRRRR